MHTFVVVLALLLTGASAEAVDGDDRRAARATIERQIEAFRKNDSATAYAQAAPQIRDLFPSPEIFIAMVERGYRPVLRPRRYSFEAAKASDDEIAQGVALQDEYGEEWLALYLLRKQADGNWRITGCHLKKAPGHGA